MAEWVSAHVDELEGPETRTQTSTRDLHEPAPSFRMKVRAGVQQYAVFELDDTKVTVVLGSISNVKFMIHGKR